MTMNMICHSGLILGGYRLSFCIILYFSKHFEYALNMLKHEITVIFSNYERKFSNVQRQRIKYVQ